MPHGQNHRCFAVDSDSSGESLLITFAALPGANGQTRFAFMDVTSELHARRAFLIDPHDVLYLKGVPGISDDISGIAAWVRAFADRDGIKRIVCLGNSAGGYGAIVVGTLAGAHVIHAINPPTILSKPEYLRNTPIRRNLESFDHDHLKTFDLDNFLGTELKSHSHVYIHYSGGASIDRDRSLLFEGMSNVHLVEYEFDDHELARSLARTGTITRMLEISLRDNHQNLPAAIRSAARQVRPFLPPRLHRILRKIRRRVTRSISNHSRFQL